ncbi:calcium activated chlorine channel, putative [Ixodes scapularis]|uniref:Calcium activated chlorine channel, putative n=1 Tax=Ixodes scapularis TaxID=6945 RepID=B7P5W9_IXOSC|nr:calcium activated chlorine channel, putative [Ixodes scapularis]|eukprot:XP_002408056.1 calcium activated chlorine channel, putative [Ixodes scapularis]
MWIGVRVCTFALGPTAEKKLEDVALQTGGTAYAFGNLKANIIAGLTVSILLSTTALMPKEEQYVVELGSETKILVTTPNDEDYDLEVQDSNGKVCATCNVTLGNQSTNIDMPQTSTTETWRLVVKPKAASIADITVVVLSKQRVLGQDPIRAESTVEHNNQQTRIYSKVTKGTAAVLGALVTATVTFGGPSGTGDTLHLLDNGIGADNLKDDGDYSAFFTQLKGAGRYSVRVDVKEQLVNEELGLVAYAGSVQVKSNLTREDLSPAPIRDLVVSEAKLDDEGMTATLSWTSMGLLEKSTMMKQRLPKSGFLYAYDCG